MKLKEFEAKKLLNLSKIKTSKGDLIKTIKDINIFNKKICKVQTLTGSRAKSGGIKIVNNNIEAENFCKKFLNKKFLDEKITEILIDELIEIKQELYLGIMFDTSKKCPVLIFSEEGGVNIEDLKLTSPEKITIQEIDYVKGLNENKIEKTLTPFVINKKKLKKIISKLYSCFIKYDCKMIEINPLAISTDNELIALDGVIILDDNANFRRDIKFQERTGNRKPTKRELKAKEIDLKDHRGVAGKTFLDLNGDIAILASGGGASITLMDALEKYGGKAANYTEYSGNPPAEKVEKLTRIVLDKQNLTGLLIAGVIANFTDIVETMRGVISALKDIKPKFPIVIRRAGPNDKEAKRMILKAKKKYNLDIHFFDENIPLTESAKIVVNLSNEYKTKN